MEGIDFIKSRKIFIFLFLFLVTSIFAQSTQIEKAKKIEDLNKEACEFTLTSNDWRVLSAIGLLLSAVFIAGLYLYGSVIDSSFINKAKEELFQLFFTLVIIIFLAFIVQTFMCSDIISSIFNLNDPPYIASYNYLSSVKNYIISAAIKMGALGSSLSLISSFEYKLDSSIAKSGLFGALINPISYFSDASLAIFSSLASAYMVILIMINILLIMPLISLKFFIPIGIVFRSIYPFRKFGGGLLGIGIALYIFIPIVLLLNNLLVGSYIYEPIKELSLQCQDNSDCYSHICEYNSTLGIKTCNPMKKEGEICRNDFECQSGFCDPSSKRCIKCVSEGFISEGLPCCNGLILNSTTKRCELGKLPGQNCIFNSDCVLSFCKTDISGIRTCTSLKKIGESCMFDEECISRRCIGIAPNKVCGRSIITEEDQSSIYASVSAFSSIMPEDAQQIITELELSRFNFENSEGKTYIDKAFDYLFKDIVITFIVGIVLPLLNLTIIAKATSDLSQALGQEIETASIWRLI
ncbi:MAG: hypothetical protein QXO35_00200 [Candidatus Micrarchaeia archaeon]